MSNYHRKGSVYNSLVWQTLFPMKKFVEQLRVKLSPSIWYTFKHIFSNATGPPKANVLFCVVGKESWAFSKACRGISCLPNCIPKLWPEISKSPQRSLAFSVTDTGILSRIGHKVHVWKDWRSDLLAKYTWRSMILYFSSCSFSSYFFTRLSFSLTQWYLHQTTSVSIKSETHPTLPRQKPD